MRFQGASSCYFTRVSATVRHQKEKDKERGSGGRLSPRVLSRRSDAAGEHEVKLLGFGDLIVRVWIPDVMLAT